MVRETFRKQFLVIGKDLALRAKKEVKEIKNRGETIIYHLNEEFVKKTKADLEELTEKMIRKLEYDSNSLISDNIRENSRQILKVKNDIYLDLKNSILKKVNDDIRGNTEKNTEFLTNSLKHAIEVFRNETLLIRANKEDLKLIKKIVTKYDEKAFTIDSNPIEAIGGCIFSNLTESMVIDSTIENLILKKENKIKRLLGNIFPEYQVQEGNSMSIAKFHEMKAKFKEPLELMEKVREKNTK